MKIIPHYIHDTINELKRIRRKKMLLNLKRILLIHEMYVELHFIKKKHPEVYKEYLENRFEFWVKDRESKEELIKSFLEIYKEMKFSCKLKFWLWFSKRR